MNFPSKNLEDVSKWDELILKTLQKSNSFQNNKNNVELLTSSVTNLEWKVFIELLPVCGFIAQSILWHFGEIAKSTFIVTTHFNNFNMSRRLHVKLNFGFLKFIYSEKATKFSKISTNYLTWSKIGQLIGVDFAKFCGLLRIYP